MHVLPRRAGVSTFVSLLVAVPLLAGCGIEDALDGMERERFEHACSNLGIARGTPSWDQCMLQQQAAERNEEQQSLNRMQEREMIRELNRRH